MFAIAVWWIWKWRNDYVFKDKKMDVKSRFSGLRNNLGILGLLSQQKVMSNNMNVCL